MDTLTRDELFIMNTVHLWSKTEENWEVFNESLTSTAVHKANAAYVQLPFFVWIRLYAIGSDKFEQQLKRPLRSADVDLL